METYKSRAFMPAKAGPELPPLEPRMSRLGGGEDKYSLSLSPEGYKSRMQPVQMFALCSSPKILNTFFSLFLAMLIMNNNLNFFKLPLKIEFSVKIGRDNFKQK